MVDQKITFFKLTLGRNDARSSDVALPNRLQATTPNTISAPVAIHAATAPALFNHFPTFKPRTLSATAKPRPTTAADMKYARLEDHACQDGPPTNRTLPAAK